MLLWLWLWLWLCLRLRLRLCLCMCVCLWLCLCLRASMDPTPPPTGPSGVQLADLTQGKKEKAVRRLNPPACVSRCQTEPRRTIRPRAPSAAVTHPSRPLRSRLVMRNTVLRRLPRGSAPLPRRHELGSHCSYSAKSAMLMRHARDRPGLSGCGVAGGSGASRDACSLLGDA
jgi:hypothetical protein